MYSIIPDEFARRVEILREDFWGNYWSKRDPIIKAIRQYLDDHINDTDEQRRTEIWCGGGDWTDAYNVVDPCPSCKSPRVKNVSVTSPGYIVKHKVCLSFIAYVERRWTEELGEDKEFVDMTSCPSCGGKLTVWKNELGQRYKTCKNNLATGYWIEITKGTKEMQPFPTYTVGLTGCEDCR